MKQRLKIRLRRPASVFLGLGLLALLALIGTSFLPKAASAATPQDSSKHFSTLTPGAYNCTVFLLSGPRSGQTQQGILTVNSNGTLSSVSVPATGSGGQGYWWVVNGQVNFSFREVLPPSLQAQFGLTDIQAVYSITNSNGNSFTSQGYALGYNSGTFAYPNQVTAQCIHQ